MTQITLLDGGMGQELVHRTGDRPTALWSTRVMVDHPGLVGQIHTDYFNAGATVATTNTYAIHHDRLKGTGLEEQFADLHARALHEATEARDAYGTGRIAGAIGPLGASYRPDLHPPSAEAQMLFADVAKLLAPKCDVILLETVSSLDQARDGLAGAAVAGLPVWLAMTVDDQDGTRLRSGEPLGEVVDIAQNGAASLLLNCSSPEAISTGLAEIADCGLPFGAYANGFEKITTAFLEDSPTVDNLTARRDLDPQAYADVVMGWVELGATVVGGCCEVGPAHIYEIKSRLIAAGHQLI